MACMQSSFQAVLLLHQGNIIAEGMRVMQDIFSVMYQGVFLYKKTTTKIPRQYFTLLCNGLL